MKRPIEWYQELQREADQERVPFEWIEQIEVLLIWLVIAATLLALSWMGLLQ